MCLVTIKKRIIEIDISFSIWLYGAVKQLSPGGLVVWLVACMFAIIIIAIDVCVNTLRIVNYGEAVTVNKDRKSELLIELGIVLLIAALLKGRIGKPRTH